MRSVDMTFNDTDIDQNAVPKLEMSFKPNAAPGFADSSRSVVPHPVVQMDLMMNMFVCFK
jgi:hypothetical protein